MLTKDIATYSATFRREGFKKFAEAGMPRRCLKNAMFLLLFASLTIAVYTVFLSAKKSVQRSGWKGLVQNMAVDGDTQMVQPGSNSRFGGPNAGFTREGQRNEPAGFDRRRQHINYIGRGRPKLEPWPNEDDHSDVLHNFNPPQNRVHEPNEEPAEEEEKEEEEGEEDHEMLPEMEELEGEKETVHPLMPNFDPENVKLRNKEGKLVGFKLFANGIQPDHDKPPEEKERDLRRRLGLPPPELKPKVKKPVITTEMPHIQRPVIPRGIIHVGDNAPAQKKPVDNLGAFHLKGDDKFDRFDRLPGWDNLGGNRYNNNNNNNNNDDNNKFGDVKNRFQDSHLRGRDFGGVARPVTNRGGLLPPDAVNGRAGLAGRDGAFNNNYGNNNDNQIPNRFGVRNELEGNDRNDARFPGDIDKRGPESVIQRPFGNNGVNPFLRPPGGAINDAVPNQIARNDGLRQGNEIGDGGHFENRALGDKINNNMIPLNQPRVDQRNLFPTHQVSDNGDMRQFARQNDGTREDFLRKAQSADNDQHQFAPKGNNLNIENVDPSFLKKLNFRDDLLEGQLIAKDGIQPLQPNQQILNRDVNPQQGLPQGSAIDGGYIGAANRGTGAAEDERREMGLAMPSQREEEEEVDQGTPLEGEKEEPETPLKIENIVKPLPVELDCIPFLFPTAQGTLCVHEVDHDTAMSGKVKSSGVWEPDMMAELSLILKSDVDLGVVDIGAGIGVYSIAAALMNRKVVAVEPLSKNYRLLHKSALENEVSSQITLVAQAIGSESYKARLHYDDESGGYSQTHVERVTEEEASADPSGVVQVTTLNNLAQALTFKSAILKIDVGGLMEADVLRSSSKFFKAVRVPYILTHWNFHTGVTKKIEVITLLSKLGYRPRQRFDDSDADPELLKQDLHYLVWALD